MLRVSPPEKEAETVKTPTITLVAIALWAGICAAAEKAPPAGGGQKILVLGTLSRQYEPVRFNHSEHISMAGGCADCHHQHGTARVDKCTECHPGADMSSFKKNADPAKLKPCRDCHPASVLPGGRNPVELKSAYHQACLKCHKKDVGEGLKTLKDCTVMCHALKDRKKQEKMK